MKEASSTCIGVERKRLLSTLWIVTMLNILTADILTLFVPEAIDEFIDFAGDTPITQLMLGGAIMIEIATLMIFLSLFLSDALNRWANSVASLITLLFVVGGGSLYPHYLFLASIEVSCLLSILFISWRWK